MDPSFYLQTLQKYFLILERLSMQILMLLPCLHLVCLLRDNVLFILLVLFQIHFTTVTAIPGSGKIVLTYPGSGNNTASPSATTFAFNNLSSANIQTNGVTCSSFTISSPTITCNVNGSGVGAATTVTILIGCSAASGVVCTTQVPTFINPAKSATAGTA